MAKPLQVRPIDKNHRTRLIIDNQGVHHWAKPTFRALSPNGFLHLASVVFSPKRKPFSSSRKWAPRSMRVQCISREWIKRSALRSGLGDELKHFVCLFSMASYNILNIVSPCSLIETIRVHLKCIKLAFKTNSNPSIPRSLILSPEFPSTPSAGAHGCCTVPRHQALSLAPSANILLPEAPGAAFSQHSLGNKKRGMKKDR